MFEWANFSMSLSVAINFCLFLICKSSILRTRGVVLSAKALPNGKISVVLTIVTMIKSF